MSLAIVTSREPSTSIFSPGSLSKREIQIAETGDRPCEQRKGQTPRLHTRFIETHTMPCCPRFAVALLDSGHPKPETCRERRSVLTVGLAPPARGDPVVTEGKILANCSSPS
jgi:hypothetical protein